MPQNLARLTLSVSLIALVTIQPLKGQTPASDAPAPVTSATWPKLAKGAFVKFYLLDTVSSSTATQGQLVHFAVAQDVLAGGKIAIPQGTPAEGVVTQVRKGVPGKHDGLLRLEPRTILLSDGSRLKLASNPPGQDDCGDMGPCWAFAAFAVALSPLVAAVLVVASPWLIHDWIADRDKTPHARPRIEGKEITLSACGFEYAYTVSAIGPVDDPATPHPVEDSATLEQLTACPAH